MSDALKQALEALKANHQWHQDHDEHDGYPDSDLEAQNVAAIAALSAPQPAQAAPLVTDDVVQRFLGWKLPADFSPDCGISFKRVHSETSPFGPQNYEPTGTNLFTAVQAQAMLEHVLEAGLARKPIWTGADEEMFWLNEIEKYQGGSNGPTIKLRAAILAAAPQPAQAVPLTDEQFDPFKGWPLDRVEVGDMGTAQIGSSYDDGSFAPVVTVDTGLYYQPQLAGPLANAIAAAIKHARAHGIKQPGSEE